MQIVVCGYPTWRVQMGRTTSTGAAKFIRIYGPAAKTFWRQRELPQLCRGCPCEAQEIPPADNALYSDATLMLG